MKSNETIRHWLWCLKVCFLTCLAQWAVCYIISFLIKQYGFTDDRIAAWTAPNGPVNTNVPGGAEIAQNSLLFLRSEQFVGLCVAIVYYQII